MLKLMFEVKAGLLFIKKNIGISHYQAVLTCVEGMCLYEFKNRDKYREHILGKRLDQIVDDNFSRGPT